MRHASISAPRRRYKKTQSLIDVIVDVVNVRFLRFSLSTRQVYYQCISLGAVQNSENGYNKVQRLVVDLRRDGTIAYGRIVDRTRAMHRQAGWAGPREVMRAVNAQYRRDLWADQETIVQIGLEKQALEGIFAEQVDVYGASLWTTHGYASAGFLYEWAEEIIKLYNEGKSVVVYYFGDWDPTGVDIERAAREGIDAHLTAQGYPPVMWSRRGLSREDFATYKLINVPVKPTDTRTRKFVERYGHDAAELDALSPDVLQARIKGVITDHIDVAAWNRLAEQEAIERESLDAVVQHWDVALAAARGAA